MPESIEQKRDRFSKLFPNRVEKLLSSLKILGNCSSKSNYEWSQDLVHDAWVQIGIIFCQTAEAFGVKFELMVDGEEVQYAQPKRKRKK